MSGQWQAAIISWQSPSGRSGGTSLAFRVEHEYGKSHWQTPTLGQVADDTITAARPLVVIDPDDREQVERLYDHLDLGSRMVHWPSVENVQAALREFANPTPPKPDEPQGLGAVVRDAEGVRWVRYTADPGRPAAWRRDDPLTASQPWERVDAVEVLSEGVVES